MTSPSRNHPLDHPVLAPGMNPAAPVPPPGHGGVFPSAFRPAWWLPGPHLQTCWPALARRVPRLALTSERLELPDGDVLDLAWTGRPKPASTAPLVVVLHGLEGSAASPYAAGLLSALAQRGWTGVLMHFRGCGGTPNRLARSYHAGETGDAAWLLEQLAQRHPAAPLAAVGFSLGGNVLLKLLGETGADAPVRAAVAVCPPLPLAACAARLERGLSRIYQRYLVTQLKSSLRTKQAAVALHSRLRLPAAGLADLHTLRAYDEAVTAPLHGFAGAAEYYARCSALPWLRDIAVPVLVVQAADDPFMGPEVLPGSGDLSPWVRSEVSTRGGHVGFISGANPLQPRYWLEERVPVYLAAQLVEAA
ncbi:MAG: hydrolase [Deferrisomatales bacterium]|nr:hydrolase [Deferrisomatales bacterium]